MAARAGGSSTGRRVASVAAVLLAPWIYRALAMLDVSRAAELVDVRGFAADASVAALTLAALMLLAWVSRWLAAGAATLLALGYYANYETIQALGMVASVLDLQYFDDPTFVRGSALALARPAALAAGLTGSFALAAWGLRGAAARDALAPLVVGGFVLGGVLQWPTELSTSEWRQHNALAYNVDWLVGSSRTDVSGSVSAMRELVPAIGADLDAPSMLPADGRARNVLLVVLESVSGNYLPAAAEHHGRQALNRMEHLDRVFADNVGYATFFTHNRRTNRGLYSLLCGEYPRLLVGTPKMAVAAGRPWRRCLPGVLAEHGYHTVFLQTAPLGFMQKDSFMPAIGFDETLGEPWFERAYHRTEWGVDDRAFFEQSLQKIDELEASGQPWFLTLLNAGTHHPYVVPPDYESPYRTGVRRAFSYLDLALRAFFQALEVRGLRNDTLILVTSDESRGAFGEVEDGAANVLSENWGFLTAMLPNRERRLVDAPFAQSDIALSVLDYLQLPHDGLDFFGRSVFREYDRGRVLFFANLNRMMVGGLKPDGSIVMCKGEGRRCARYAGASGRIFAPTLEAVQADDAFAETVREMGQRSLPPSGDAALQVPLVARPLVHVPQTSWLWVQGISQLALQPDEWVEVELEAESLGPDPVVVQHLSKARKKHDLLRTMAVLDPGETFRVRYTLASDIPLARAVIRTRARLLKPGSADLVFRKRRFEIRRAGERPAQGVQIERLDIDPPPEGAQRLQTKLRPIEPYAERLRRDLARGYDAEADDDADDEADDGF